MDARSGLSAARLSALSVVVYGGPLTMSELARAERVSNPTITSTVSGLESAGLVARTRPAGDARSHLTDADRAALSAAVDPLERLVHQPPC